MRKIGGLIIAVVISLVSPHAQSFYDLSFKTVGGEKMSLSKYAGLKVMFYILPLSKTDTKFSELESFKKRYKDSIQIIGVLSIEDGYQSSNAAAIQALYLNMDIVLMEGVHTRKSAGSEQSPVMKWLTDKRGNKHFDVDVAGVGQKFMVTQTGRLFAVIPPDVSLQGGVLNRIIQGPSKQSREELESKQKGHQH